MAQDELRLALLIGDEWRDVLNVPTHELDLYTTNRLSWLTYVGYAISGAEKSEPDQPLSTVKPCNGANNLVPHPERYYYVQGGNTHLVDTDGFLERTSLGSSSSQPRDNHLLAQVTSRDNHRCVVTGMSGRRIVQRAHLIPHCRGDNYIKHVSEARNLSNASAVKEIDDPRNVITLLNDLHQVMKDFAFAFLQVPNYSLGISDVPTPIIPIPTDYPHSIRIHVQIFDQSLRDQDLYDMLFDNKRIYNNKPLLLPANLDNWPPDYILTFMYAAAVFSKWGMKDSLADQKEAIAGAYPRDGDGEYEYSGSDNDDDSGDDDRTTDNESHHSGHTARTPSGSRKALTGRTTRRSDNNSTFANSMFMDGILALWGRNVSAERHRQVLSWLGLSS